MVDYSMPQEVIPGSVQMKHVKTKVSHFEMWHVNTFMVRRDICIDILYLFSLFTILLERRYYDRHIYDLFRECLQK